MYSNSGPSSANPCCHGIIDFHEEIKRTLFTCITPDISCVGGHFVGLDQKVFPLCEDRTQTFKGRGVHLKACSFCWMPIEEGTSRIVTTATKVILS